MRTLKIITSASLENVVLPLRPLYAYFPRPGAKVSLSSAHSKALFPGTECSQSLEVANTRFKGPNIV